MTTSARSRGLTLASAAESHERFRLGYPDEVVDRTLAYAGRPVATAVEIGAGTGKATRAFASRGVRVIALEHVPDMFSVLQREAVGMQVDPVPSAFEEYDGPPVDLVFAAGSWHLTDPITRWAHAADLLVDGGALAVFGARVCIADPAVQAAVAQACRTTLDDSAFQPPGGASGRRRVWPGDELDGSPLFTDVEDHLLAREVLLPHREYIGYLTTLSALLELPLEERQHVLRRIGYVVPDQVRVDITIRLVLARRS